MKASMVGRAVILSKTKGGAVQEESLVKWQPGEQSCPAVCWARSKGSADISRV